MLPWLETQLLLSSYKRFIQQLFIFITALERSREHARDKTEHVSAVTQVQRYLNLHCSNSSDKRTLLLFLEIISDLEGGLNTCREVRIATVHYLLILFLLHSYPHNEINWLSCDEARNSYGGIVSVIPLALDLLTIYIAKNVEMVADLDKETSKNRSRFKKGTGGWHAGKPALKPPGGHTRK
uniref:Sperm acrosome associated 9 n=1 Tax=Sinocyclocheilus grahami TaxID=75366 RepID=A0A672KQA1_SINGR